MKQYDVRLELAEGGFHNSHVEAENLYDAREQAWENYQTSNDGEIIGCLVQEAGELYAKAEVFVKKVSK